MRTFPLEWIAREKDLGASPSPFARTSLVLSARMSGRRPSSGGKRPLRFSRMRLTNSPLRKIPAGAPIVSNF